MARYKLTETVNLPSLLIVFAHSKDPSWLNKKVAGLSLINRIIEHAKRAKYDFYIFTDKKTEKLSKLPLITNTSQLNCEGYERIVVTKPDSLPSIECLKAIKRHELKENEVLIHDYLLAFKPSKDCFELKKLLEPNGFTQLQNFLMTFLQPVNFKCKSGQIYDLTTPFKIKQAEKEMFKALIKDTEGFMSKHVERRISLAISKRLVNTSITPNQITIISILIGLIGAGFISISQGFWQITGALLFLFHSIIDGCDGEIARIKFMESRFGGILDFWGDNIVHAAIFCAIGIEWAARENKAFPLMLSAISVIGTFISAFIIYRSTMKDKKKSGPLYTSVSNTDKKSKIVKLADFLSRRDFIYLVVILAFYRHLDWFLLATAFGTMAFAATLIWIRFKRA